MACGMFCFDEEITGIGELKTVHSLRLIDELNIKPGRVGGLVNSLELLDYCLQNEIPCWIGGMFETGIGRSINLNLASFCTRAKGHDTSPSSRYFLEDIVNNPVVMNEEGMVNLSKFGQAEVDESRIEKYLVRRKKLIA